MLNPLDDILRKIVAHQLGIVPLSGVPIHHDVNKILTGLPRDEARKMRRKFRKLWRTAVRQRNTNNAPTFKKYVASISGLGSPKPDKRNKSNRKLAVSRHIEETHVAQMRQNAGFKE